MRSGLPERERERRGRLVTRSADDERNSVYRRVEGSGGRGRIAAFARVWSGRRAKGSVHVGERIGNRLQFVTQHLRRRRGRRWPPLPARRATGLLSLRFVRVFISRRSFKLGRLTARRLVASQRLARPMAVRQRLYQNYPPHCCSPLSNSPFDLVVPSAESRRASIFSDVPVTNREASSKLSSSRR